MKKLRRKGDGGKENETEIVSRSVITRTGD